MKIRSWWRQLSFFWKTFLYLLISMLALVALVEGVAEPLAEDMLLSFSGEVRRWHDVLLWVASVIIPALACSYFFANALARKINAMASAAARMSRGNFAARLEVCPGSRDVFDRLAGSFNDMAQSLESLIADERRLLTDISHELRSPLARMHIALELLPLKEDGAERERLIRRLEKDVRHMNELVEMLLAQSRERLLALNAEEEAVDLSALLQDVVTDIAFNGQPEGKTVTSVVPSGVLVMGYAPLFRTMLMNVGMNALFYTPPGRPVYVYLARGDGEVRIHIRDFGTGVAEADLENIFRIFYRADDSRTRATGGAGLGLALAREAATLCGGVLEARNANPGLEVCARFPALPALPEAGEPVNPGQNT
ncbi:putative Histidine kinase [uncultured delta proteobacterium]|uniref:histidine kinase n=1 Tax=uncultured delta proteobacterium TaxID=34034 RepID=A0A212JN81_9DELT|nr:putative Histidine kinase [uncultured delta proteobacterium]